MRWFLSLLRQPLLNLQPTLYKRYFIFSLCKNLSINFRIVPKTHQSKIAKLGLQSFCSLYTPTDPNLAIFHTNTETNTFVFKGIELWVSTTPVEIEEIFGTPLAWPWLSWLLKAAKLRCLWDCSSQSYFFRILAGHTSEPECKIEVNWHYHKSVYLTKVLEPVSMYFLSFWCGHRLWSCAFWLTVSLKH